MNEKKPEAKTFEVVAIDDVIELLNTHAMEACRKAEEELQRNKERMNALEAVIDDFQGSKQGKLKRDYDKAMTFIRYCAGMDQAFYRKPNDWHIGLEMTARAKNLMKELGDK